VRSGLNSAKDDGKHMKSGNLLNGGKGSFENVGE